MTVTPHYYLEHNTPAGPRYAYPTHGIPGFPVRNVYTGRTRTGKEWEVDGRITDPRYGHVVVNGWLIANEPLPSVTVSKPGPRVRAGLRKRSTISDDVPVSPDLRAAFEALPDEPTADMVAHYEEHDASHSCWDCRIYSVSYAAHYVDGDPIVTTVDLSDWMPLPGVPDPDPGRGWVVTDPSLLAVYGEHTAHLWPGRLDGLREEVGRRLKAHPLVREFHDWHESIGSGYRHKGFAVTIVVPWETPRTKTIDVTRQGRRRKEHRTVDDYAMSVQAAYTVDSGAWGATKAAAIASFDEQVEQHLARFFPFGNNPRACDHCDGTGRVGGDHA